MEIKVFWTETAIAQLEYIFDYHKYSVSITVAHKIVTNIVDRTILLVKNPLLGTVEPLLKKNKKEFRFLVEGNYKIIYLFEKNIVYIYSVFDCRQNPVKLKV